MKYRKEKDSMGTVQVPADAYYGSQTQRAVDNFPISDLRFQAALIHALALVKHYAAQVNCKLKLLDPDLADAISRASREVMDGKHDGQFVVDIFQTGSGTSTNMNMNEVVASRANEILSGQKGGKSPVHPNDHVNLGQSSNDVIPSVIHISALMLIDERLIPALQSLHRAGRVELLSPARVARATATEHGVELTLEGAPIVELKADLLVNQWRATTAWNMAAGSSPLSSGTRGFFCAMQARSPAIWTAGATW